MAILTCGRCGEQTAKLDKCQYCNKLMCVACIKSSRRVGKTKRATICKDCWGKMGSRKKFKTET